jgi:2'-5' RNA ligase
MWAGIVSAELMPVLSESYLAAASTLWQGMSEAFPSLIIPPVSDIFAQDYLASAVNRLVGIGDIFWEAARASLLEGTQLGESIPKLAMRVADAAGVSSKRANVIARTEVLGAASAGGINQVRLAGLVGTKEWLDTNDSRTRCTHRDAGGQTVDLNGKFTLGGLGSECPDTVVSYLDRPGDPDAPASEIIQCRCSLAYDLNVPSEDKVLTAAAEVHTGAMIAFRMTEADARCLEVAGFEDADQLHTTVLYLGEAANWSPEEQAQVQQIVADLAGTYAPIATETFSVNVFNPHDPDMDTAVVLGVRGGDSKLVALKQALHLQVEDAFADKIPENHTPWVPHITLAYTDDQMIPASVQDRLGPISFDRVRVAFAGEVTDHSLTGRYGESTGESDVLTAADFDPLDHPRGAHGKFIKKGGGGAVSGASIWDALEQGHYTPGQIIAHGSDYNGTSVRLKAVQSPGGKWGVKEEYKAPDGTWTPGSSSFTKNGFLGTTDMGKYDSFAPAPGVVDDTNVPSGTPTVPSAGGQLIGAKLLAGEYKNNEVIGSGTTGTVSYRLVAIDDPKTGKVGLSEQKYNHKTNKWEEEQFVGDLGLIDTLDFKKYQWIKEIKDVTPTAWMSPSAPNSPRTPSASKSSSKPTFKMPDADTFRAMIETNVASGKIKGSTVIAEWTDPHDGKPMQIAVIGNAPSWGVMLQKYDNGQWNTDLAAYNWVSSNLSDILEVANESNDLNVASTFGVPNTPSTSSVPTLSPGISTPSVSTKPLKKVDKLTNAIIYGKYSEGEVIATNDNGIQRIVYKNNKIVQQVDPLGNGTWGDIQTWTKGQAYKELQGAKGPWSLGEVVTPKPATPKVTAPTAPSVPTLTLVSVNDKVKIKTQFANGDVKWWTDSSKMLDQLVTVQSTHPQYSLGQILEVMDGTTSTKTSPTPFTDKIKKYLGTKKGKDEFSALTAGTGLSASSLLNVGGTNSNTATPSILKSTGINTGLTTPGNFPELSLTKANAMHAVMNQQHGLWSAKSKSSIQAYTGSTYSSINCCLRGKCSCTPSATTHAKNITEGMRPIPQNVKVFRGSDWSPFNLYGNNNANAAELQKRTGQLMTDPGFMSTSISKSGKFGGSVTYEIDLPAGTPAAWAYPVSSHKTEQELILGAGLKYRIKEVLPPTGGHYTTLVRLEVVP